MGQKKRVLVFCEYYLPGFKAGGPIRTISNMVELLGDSLEFYIVTSDRDSLDQHPYSHLQDSTGWQDVGKAKVMYLSPDDKSFTNLRRIVLSTPHDFLYLNSFFNFTFSIKPLILRRLGLLPKKRIILAPRGEFSEGALGLKSRKKIIFFMLSRLSRLHKGVRWQASSIHEKEDIARHFKYIHADEVFVALNLPDVSMLAKTNTFVPRELGEPLRIVFLSRISPMKNLDYAIKLLSNVRRDIVFDFFGAVNDEQYYLNCLGLLDNAEKQRYRYLGVLNHDKVVETLSGYDLFLFPTKGENYGHVILEALAAGTPVLISENTPWKDLAENDAGWVLPLDQPEKFIEKIEFMAELPPLDQLALREKVVAYARTHLINEDNIALNKELFT